MSQLTGFSTPRAVRTAPDAPVMGPPSGWRPGRTRDRIARALLVGDLAVLALALGAAQIFKFGLWPASLTGAELSYTTVSVLLAAAWWVSLHVHRTRDMRIVGHGPEEYRRIVTATFRTFALLALATVAFKLETSRIYLAVAFPLGLLGLLIERKLLRSILHRRRAAGRGLDHVVVVGGESSALRLTNWLDRHPAAGYRVVARWSPKSPTSRLADHRPANEADSGSRSDVMAAVWATRASAVIVSDTEYLGPAMLRELTWELEGTGVEMLISPNVVDTSPRRLYLHDVSGMPLLHVEEPQHFGAGGPGKRMLDVGLAALLLVLGSPLLLVTAAAVKVTSRGPVFYRQERVGRMGQPFRMTKFRSMVVDADRQLEALSGLSDGDGVLFKMHQDPRVTTVGRLIRRYSIDELPQLLDVLRGSMSLVGPRPPLASEVAQYSPQMHRRMFVRPGMTGLWQVSGRSDLPFEEAERLDLAYVDNWSIMGDLMIILRTVRVVVQGQGAY